MPFLAKAYASDLIAELSSEQSTLHSGAVDGGSGRTPLMATGANTRQLPLLSPSARRAWQAGGEQISLMLGRQVLGPQYEALQAEAERQLEDYPQAALAQEGFGRLRAKVESQIKGADVAEEDVLDLAGVLLLEAARDAQLELRDPSVDPHEGLAFVLASAAAATYGTCDSHLAFAHALSLSSRFRPELVRREWGKAASSCPGDPTPVVESAFYTLANVPLYFCGVLQPARASDYSSALQSFELIQRAFPRIAAGWTGAGDVHSVTAAVIDTWGGAALHCTG